MAWRSNRNRTDSDSDSDDLSAFSLADALSQVRSSRQAPPPPPPQPQPRPRQIFSFYGAPPRIDSHQSIDTSASFATANESVPPATPASHFADPEETTMPPKSKKSAKGAPAPTPAKPAPKPKAALPVVIAERAPAPAPVAPTPVSAAVAPVASEEEARFDVAQTAYGAAKDAWAWGRTVPVITNLLGIAEAVASKVVDVTVHMDLPAIDQQAVTPQLKKLDDGVVTPAILAVWKIVGPAVARGEEMVVKPVLTEVVPRVLAPLGMFGEKKGKKGVVEEKEAMIDASPTPEVVPAM